MVRRFTRLPPAASEIGWEHVRAALQVTDPQRVLEGGLQRLLGAEVVTLHASGREALRVALDHLAVRSRRSEVVVPAYTCFSVPAAVVAAGLRVRLVDVTADGKIDPDALAKLPLERVAAVVVSNLLGIAESTTPLQSIVAAAGVALVDDAAQSLGVRTPEGPVGGRGHVGVLSFGRGKPLCALGGGALAWAGREGAVAPPPVRPRRVAALARAGLYRAALVPAIFRWLAAVPALRIGETVYDPGFRRGGIDGASLCLAAARLPHLEVESLRWSTRTQGFAARLRERTRFRPLGEPSAGSVYPRLGVLAPSAGARDAALAALASLGATRMYPSPLDRVPALRRHLLGPTECPGAQEFAARLLTLPSHAGLGARDGDRIVATLERLPV